MVPTSGSIVHSGWLIEINRELGNCPNCQAKLELKKTFVHRKGLVSNIKSVCSDHHCP